MFFIVIITERYEHALKKHIHYECHKKTTIMCTVRTL